MLTEKGILIHKIFVCIAAMSAGGLNMFLQEVGFPTKFQKSGESSVFKTYHRDFVATKRL